MIPVINTKISISIYPNVILNIFFSIIITPFLINLRICLNNLKIFLIFLKKTVIHYTSIYIHWLDYDVIILQIKGGKKYKYTIILDISFLFLSFISVYIYLNMALAPQFAGHRLGSALAPHTLEVYLDYVVCGGKYKPK
jgi:hypothetical protein